MPILISFFLSLVMEKQKECYVLDLTEIDLNKDIPADFLQGIEKVYIVAGMGGETGTKWASIISQYIKKKGNHSVTAIVSEPFEFEGMKKLAKAQEGIIKIADSKINRLISIKCEELYKRCVGIDFFNAFLYADKAILTVIE